MSDTFLTDTLRAEIDSEREPRDRSNVRIYSSACSDLLEVRDPSGKPSGCRRKVYLDFWPERVTPEPMDFATKLNLKVGDAYHGTVEEMLKAAGVVVIAERPLKNYQPETQSGRLDWLVRHPKKGLAIIDGKSMSPYRFEHMLPEDGSALLGDVAQVHSYVEPVKKFLAERGIPFTDSDLKYGAILYFNKATGELDERWFEINPEIGAYVDAVAKEVRDKIVADKTLGTFDPYPIPEGAKSYSYPCSWSRGTKRCKFYAFCHPEKARAADEKPLKLRG